jgi:hypothetical protein
MTPDPVSPGSVRSEADINEDIRALYERAGGPLSDEQRVEYRRYLAEYAAAVRERMAAAA